MFAGMSMLDLAGMAVSFILTVLVLLYAFEDNALFRLAVYLFIGVAAGYAGAVALKDVLLPRLFSLEYLQMLIVILLRPRASKRVAVAGGCTGPTTRGSRGVVRRTCRMSVGLDSASVASVTVAASG